MAIACPQSIDISLKRCLYFKTDVQKNASVPCTQRELLYSCPRETGEKSATHAMLASAVVKAEALQTVNGI